MKGLSNVVADYTSRYRERAEKELRWFAIQRTFEDAVSLAALAKGPSGKRLSHQTRVTESSLAESRRRLLNCLPALRRTRAFQELHEIVSAQIRPIPGIGKLTVYDTALRIAAKLGLEPTAIYLHAGTRVGAKKLGLDVSRQTLAVSEVPAPLRKLKPREIEDILCIYKDHFGSDHI